MSFLDDELLALAGDVSGSEDDAASIASNHERSHSRSQSRTSKHSPLLPREASVSRRSASPAAAASPKKRARAGSAVKSRSRKKARRDEDEETESEGEIKEDDSDDVTSIESGEEPESFINASMDLASDTSPPPTRSSRRGRAHSSPSDDDDGSDTNEAAADLYPLEGKYIDHADKAALLAMTEVEREAVLAERAAKLEREHLDRQLRNLLKSRNAEGGQPSGAGADVSGVRKSGRTKSAPKKSEEVSKRGKLEELRRQREERKAGGGKTLIADEDASKPLIDDDDDDMGRGGDVVEEREITLEDVNRAKIGRTGLAKLCDYPNFEDVVKDCFVRVSLGASKPASAPVYRVCQIRSLTTGKPYSLLAGRRTTTTHLLVAHGSSTRAFSMEYMSDGLVTAAEFARYKTQLNVDRIPLPSTSFLHQKTQELKDLDSRVLTEDELNQIIRKRKEGAWDPVVHKLKLDARKHKLVEAIQSGNDSEMARLEKEIQELEDQEREHRETRPGHSVVAMRETQMARMARMNAENRKKNQEEIRRAELEEKKIARMQAEEAKRKGQVETLANPFARVKTVVKFRHEVGKKKEEQVKTDVGAVEGDAGKKDVGVGLESKGGAGVEAAKPRLVKKGVDDVIAAMDIEIEL